MARKQTENKFRDVPLGDEIVIALECKVCKKAYTEYLTRKCFAFNMQLEYSADICITCRLYKAAKLECAIMDLADDLGLTICKEKSACTALLNKTKILKREVLPDDLQSKLDEIPLTYPRNTGPSSCKRCLAPLENMDKSQFVFLSKEDINGFVPKKEIIEKYLSGKLSEDNGSTQG